MMRSRKGTPDIISGLMTGSASTDKIPTSNKAINIVDNKAVDTASNIGLENLPNSKTFEVDSNKTLKQSDLKACKLESNKVTFNLSLSTIQALDDAWIMLRRSKLSDAQRVTKTLIVEMAVKIALAELDENGELSELYRALKI